MKQLPARMLHQAKRALTRWLLVGLLLGFAPATAQAHTAGPGRFQTFTQKVGPYELAITIEVPRAAPAPLKIDIVVPPDSGDTTIILRAVPRGASPTTAPTAEVKTTAGAETIYAAEVAVDRLGEWDLVVQANGPAGQGMALLPFTVVQDSLPPYTIQLLSGLGALVVLMIASIAVSAIYNARRVNVPRWLSRVLGQGMFAVFVAVVIFGVQQYSESIRLAQAANAPLAGRPHANLAVRTLPDTPVTGTPLELTLAMSDGGTGRPVEDIITHHDALVHLVIISDDGSFFEHTHPARTAPGTYAVSLTPTQPGRYTVYAEIERTDSGTQVVRGEFTVTGKATAPPVQPQPLGPQQAGEYTVTVAASQTPIRVGQQTTFTASIADANGPVRDLRPWLGMAGHFLGRSMDGSVFAHVHAAETVPPNDRPGVVLQTKYGPDVRFVYSFPQPGEYRVWMQFNRAGKIITVPLKINVQP